MGNIINNPSLIVSIIGLSISIGALIISYLSYVNSNRPFIKLSIPKTVSGKNNLVEISVELTNFGKNTAEIISACVDTVNAENERFGVVFSGANIILYPGDSQRISVNANQVDAIEGSSVVIDWLDVSPGAFIFKVEYCSKDYRVHKFTEVVMFPSLQWT